jgi:hypothetical protein
MDLNKVLAQLHAERDTLNSVISGLERLEQGRHRGPGRPPGWTAKNPANGVDASPNPPHGEGRDRNLQAEGGPNSISGRDQRHRTSHAMA